EEAGERKGIRRAGRRLRECGRRGRKTCRRQDSVLHGSLERQPHSRARRSVPDAGRGAESARAAQRARPATRHGEHQVRMTWLDYAVLVMLAISIGWGVYRGLVHEVMS